MHTANESAFAAIEWMYELAKFPPRNPHRTNDAALVRNHHFRLLCPRCIYRDFAKFALMPQTITLHIQPTTTTAACGVRNLLREYNHNNGGIHVLYAGIPGDGGRFNDFVAHYNALRTWTSAITCNEKPRRRRTPTWFHARNVPAAEIFF